MMNAEVSKSRYFIQHSAFSTVFLLLSVAWTWPLATRLSTRIAHDAGDPVLNAWILWWNTQALPFTDRWWNPGIFYPVPGALALSEHLFGITLFTTPLHWLGLNPAAVYNVALIAVCWLSAFFAYLLGCRLTGSTFGGLVCGLAFGFAPYRAGQLAHVQVLASQWMPLALLAMHAFVTDGRRRWLVLFGVAWMLQALSNGYYLLFFPLLVGAWLLWFGTARQKAALAATFALSSLTLLPTLLKYREVHDAFDLRRTMGEMLMFSARPSSFLQIPDLLAFWPATPSPTPEGHLFPGATVVVLVVAGALVLLRRRQLAEAWRTRSAALFYALATLLFWWLCFGPARETGVSDTLTRPYTVLMWLPGFEGLRVPARFAMLATLCIAAAASIAAVRILPRSRRVSMPAAALTIVGLLADGWLETMPLVPVPSRFPLPPARDAIVLELPLDDPDVGVSAMYRAISHGRPLVNGYSGHFPPHHGLLATALRRGDPTALRFLASGRPLIVLVHRELDPEGEWRAFVQEAGGQPQDESGLGPVLVVPPQPRDKQPPPGRRLASQAHPQGAGYAAVDLGSEQIVRSIELDLTWRYDDVATRSLIETSLDGETWTRVWEGWTGGLAVAGTLEDQRRAPLRFTVPDVRARYLRISPAPPWVAEALRVFGAR